MVKVGLIAIDGTKVHANASQHANRDYEQLAREILEEADAVDAAEDERFGDVRGDELPGAGHQPGVAADFAGRLDALDAERDQAIAGRHLN